MPESLTAHQAAPEAWVDGAFVAADSPALPVLDQAYLSGMGAFETVRADHGVPWFLEAHHTRLRETAAMFDLDVPGLHVLDDAVRRLLARRGMAAARVRITVSGSVPPDGTPFRLGGHSRTSVIAFPLPTQAPEPLRLTTAPHRIDANSPLAGRKCTSYALHALAIHHARKQGCDEAVLRNHLGEIVSGAVSNLFWVKHGRVHTPDLQCGCRPGVTRQRVLDACAKLGIEVESAHAQQDALAGADEIFTTSAIRGLSTVRELDGKSLAPGEIAHRLREALESEVDPSFHDLNAHSSPIQPSPP